MAKRGNIELHEARGVGEEAGPSVLIRAATVEDATSISRVLEEAFAGYERLYTVEAYRATTLPPAGIVDRMKEGPVWIAFLNGRPAGTASAVVTDAGCYIRGMAAIPAAQGHGIGRALLDRIAHYGQTNQQTRLYLSTTPFLDRAIALYRRAGFDRSDDGPSTLHGTPLFTMEKKL